MPSRPAMFVGPLIAFAVGVALLVVSEPDRSEALVHLMRDIGIAAIVSTMIFSFIELRTHLAREQELKENVIDQVYGEMAGPEVWADVKASIIESGITCEQWHLTCTISVVDLWPIPPQREGPVPEKAYLSSGTVKYTLMNHHNTEQAVPLRHELQYVATGSTSGGVVPRFTGMTYTILAPDAVPVTVSLDEERLRAACEASSGVLLEILVALEPGARINVEIGREELLHVPGEFPWYVFWLTKHPRITIHNEAAASLDCHVLLRHHRGTQAILDEQTDTWKLPAIILPGQGFAIMTRQHQGSSAELGGVSSTPALKSSS